MNHAVNQAIHDWFPEEEDHEPCLLELVDDDGEMTAGEDTGRDQSSLKVMVLCEDYGQAINLPSYRYFHILFCFIFVVLKLVQFSLSNGAKQYSIIFLQLALDNCTKLGPNYIKYKLMFQGT